MKYVSYSEFHETSLTLGALATICYEDMERGFFAMQYPVTTISTLPYASFEEA